ncbi:MAG TPA: NAD-dependent epimerase/dehydratase family protein [Allosphingosinicella sp.]|jgi:nucleoside-diphosphate-sugar epimerase
MSRTALLTGVTGFIGGTLARRLLAEGWRVHAIVRPGSDVGRVTPHERLALHAHDGGTESLIRLVQTAAPDVAFHLASLFLADHRPDQIEALVASNLLFPVQLAEALTRTGVLRLVNTGTAWQHRHSEPYLPVNLYAATKQAFEDLLLYHHDACGLSVVTLKLFDTYGAGDPRRKLIGILLEAARTGEALPMSPGEQVLDLTHVEDAVEGYLIAAERLLASKEPLRETYFLPGERHRLRDLVRLVERAVGRPLDVNFGGRAYRPREVMNPIEAESDRLLPGWTRRRDLLTTLPELLAP